MRGRGRRVAPFAVPVLIASGALSLAIDEDSSVLMERGTLNWIEYQQLKLGRDVYEIGIPGEEFDTPQLEIVLPNLGSHARLIFANEDRTYHRIVFEQHIGNDLGYQLRSPIINQGERWAIDVMRDGYYPYHCSVHAETMRGILEVRYEDDSYW